MQMPFEMQHAAHARANPSRRAMSLGIVGALHLALLYALIHSMTGGAIFIPKGPIDLIPVHDTTAKSKPVEPVKVRMIQPAGPDVRMPTWSTLPDNNGEIPQVPGEVHPAGDSSPPPTAAAGIASTHTIPPYPELARRMGVHGAVQLHIYIAVNGTVSRAAVVHSSGNDLLDQTAVAWVIANWKYRPATVAGDAVPGESEALVVFDLRNAR